MIIPVGRLCSSINSRRDGERRLCGVVSIDSPENGFVQVGEPWSSPAPSTFVFGVVV